MTPAITPIHNACTANASARGLSPLPNARAIAAETPLPMAPAPRMPIVSIVLSLNPAFFPAYNTSGAITA
jgi:hypothetical protein